LIRNFKIQYLKGLRLIIKLYGLTCFLIIFTTYTSRAQDKSFAGITFRFNDLTHRMFLNELETIKNSKLLGRNEISKFAAILPLIEPILKEGNIPDDFKFLSIYKKFQVYPEIIHHSESSVYWSINEATANTYNLRVSGDVDDRKHLVKATYAAVEKIGSDFQATSNWAETLYMQLASERIVSKLSEQLINSTILLDTPEYSALIDFLAFKTYIETHFVSFTAQERNMIYPYKSGAGKTLGELSQELELDIHQVIIDNQWLLRGKIPHSYPVFLSIPIARYQEIKKIDIDQNVFSKQELGFPLISLNEKFSKGLGGTFFTINGLPGIQAEMGDKFINLAYKSALSHKKFLAYNDMQPMDDIKVGEIYYLKEKNNKAPIPFHIAKRDETLWGISQQYAVKLKKILEFNRLNTVTKLVPGQLIWLQEKRPRHEPIQYAQDYSDNESEPLRAAAPAVNTLPTNYATPKELSNTLEKVYILPRKLEQPQNLETKVLEEDTMAEPPKKDTISKKKYLVHSVEIGDTLSSISKKYNVTVKQLLTLNNLINSSIEVGDKIIIKRN
jgi:membrane-bound lytic murein transglycosylase D